MNKTRFIEELARVNDLSIEDATKVNNVIEESFIFDKDNRNSIITKISSTLDIDITKASDIYDKSITIINDAIKNKLKNPFKNEE